MNRSADFNMSRARRPNTTPGQRARWVRRLRESGLSQQAFARQHGLCLSTLGVWIKQTEQAVKTASQPVPLGEVSLPALLSPWAAEVARRDGTIVRMTAQLAREWLPKVLDSGAC